ncbi:hypothetical protein D9758_008321 [Tetrapyrgos nigripes]|uniref:Uncharacterized protein n=1 Tax=Tetrapyrgos nigripes TaxID=182062 RepID=A0A8H5GE05_9AGAR|nr:hypothetical protein D9758_008321 [Tetrapyrgos nigripes]
MFIHLRCEREAYVDLAKLYLDRSSPTLLKLEFPSSRDISSPAYAPIFNVGTHVGILLLQAFMQERWRWRVVDFNPTTIGMFCQLLQVQPGNCENLETLCLPDSIEFADIPVDLFCSMLGQTPKLQTLVADVYNVRQLVKGLPCNQITTISLPGKTAQRTNWGDHHSLFSHFPNLQELLVTSLFDPWLIVHGGTLLPNVRKLTVEDRYWFDSNGDMLSLSNIFKALKIPSLSTLVLEFLRISACHLQHLKLIGDLLDTRKLLELLRQLPTLEHLSIQNGHGRLRVFEGLTVKRRSNKGGEPMQDGSPSQAEEEDWSTSILLPRLTQLDVTIRIQSQDLKKPSKKKTKKAKKVKDTGGHGQPSAHDSDSSDSDQIYAMVRSRMQHPGRPGSRLDSVGIADMRYFRIILLGTNSEATRKWLDSFRLSTIPQLRALTKEGLQLEVD